MVDQGFSGRIAKAGHHVDDAGWETNFRNELGQTNGREWSQFGGLEHYGATRRERRGNLGDCHRERPVPWSDRTDHTDRLA